MKRLIRNMAAALLALVMLIPSASALTVEQAIGLLERHYVQDLPSYVYEAETLEELFEELGDPYTDYMDAEEHQAFLDSVESTVSLVGIGVSIEYTEEGILLTEILEEGPAKEAGFQEGDLIVAVDGVSCAPADETHRALILGEEGTQVTLTIKRGEELSDHTLTRREVVVPNTTIKLLDEHIGYIECVGFGSDTGALFQEIVAANDEAVDCWLVDMRGNSGGYTEAAVTALGVFGGPGYHLYLRDSGDRVYYYAYEQEPGTEKLAVVLVNGDSASAAEAFSAGMRDLRTGLTVGTRTFGKGSAQVIYDKETYPEIFTDDALKLTAYQFYSGNGVTADRVGVIPTLLVTDETAYDVALAICGSEDIPPEDTLLLDIDNWTITLNVAKMAPATLTALFEALPPGATLWLYEDGVEAAYSISDVAEKLGVTYESRWFDDVTGSLFSYEINTLATYGVLHGDGAGNFYPQDTLTRAEACAMLAKALGMTGSSRQRFADVAADNAYAPYINAMAEKGFVLGMGDGTFCPDRSVTQQEFYIMLARAACYLNLNFDFAADAITDEQRALVMELGFRSWACDGALLVGEADGWFDSSGELSPTEPILREEAAASLWAVLLSAGILPG